MSDISRDNSSLPTYIEYLLLPGSYPHPVADVQLLQTHISFVILAGNFVYKWKKPVNFGFVDFSSLAQREFYCRRELLLNRRLCPAIYLDTVSLCQEGTSYKLQGQGAVVEYGVKMVRMPESGMLNRVIAAGDLKEQHLAAIVEILVPFYLNAEQGEEIRENGRVAAVARTITDNFDQTKAFVGGPALSRARFTGIKKATDAFLRRRELFTKRMETACIRDCHGDLYSNNICLAENGTIHIFDCLEFNDRLRAIDICSDVAFLAMDLDYHGLFSLSDFFINLFRERSGDEGLLQLLDFYKCYRAYVRGKVGVLAAADPTMGKEASEEWLQSGARYFRLAEEYAGRL